MTELENVHMQQSQITQVTLGQRQFTKINVFCLMTTEVQVYPKKQAWDMTYIRHLSNNTSVCVKLSSKALGESH